LEVLLKLQVVLKFIFLADIKLGILAALDGRSVVERVELEGEEGLHQPRVRR